MTASEARELTESVDVVGEELGMVMKDIRVRCKAGLGSVMAAVRPDIADEIKDRLTGLGYSVENLGSDGLIRIRW